MASSTCMGKLESLASLGGLDFIYWSICVVPKYSDSGQEESFRDGVWLEVGARSIVTNLSKGGQESKFKRVGGFNWVD